MKISYNWLRELVAVELSPEELRERLSQLLRRYVPATTLPTPISNGSELETNDAPTSRSSVRSSDAGVG